MEREFFLSLIAPQRYSKRAKQKRIGPSEMRGCARKLWHRLQDTPTTNSDTLIMASWMGTAIHSQLEASVRQRDPFGERYLLEQRLEWEDYKGQVDCFDKQEGEVIDWKTTKKRTLVDYPTETQIAQINMYGFLLEKHGMKVNTVTIVGIPRDGTEDDVVIHSQPYDRANAEESMHWVDKVKEAFIPPAPEKPRFFCRSYCQYYDPTGEVGCPSKGGR